jgi:hypothetical protein
MAFRINDDLGLHASRENVSKTPPSTRSLSWLVDIASLLCRSFLSPAHLCSRSCSRRFDSFDREYHILVLADVVPSERALAFCGRSFS